MIVSRVLLLLVLLSNCVAFNMENDLPSRSQIDSILKAINVNDIEYIERYIANGGDINAKGTISANQYMGEIKEMTLLITAAFYGRPKLMKIFIKNGAELDCINEHGDTALIMVARVNYSSLAKLLVESGANRDICNKEGKTALQVAEESLLRPFYRKYYPSKNHSFTKLIKLLSDKEDNLTLPTHMESHYKMASSLLRHDTNSAQLYRQIINTGYSPVLYIQQ